MTNLLWPKSAWRWGKRWEKKKQIDTKQENEGEKMKKLSNNESDKMDVISYYS